MTQKQLAELADMAQPRISKMERPGEEAFNIETLVRLAAAFKVGLKVEFVPFGEMLAWENGYSQDAFNPTPIEQDRRFLNPALIVQSPALTATLNLPDVALVAYQAASEAFTAGIKADYQRYVSLAGRENIILGSGEFVIANQPLAAEAKPLGQTDLVTVTSYKEVPMSLIAANAGVAAYSERIA